MTPPARVGPRLSRSPRPRSRRPHRRIGALRFVIAASIAAAAALAGAIPGTMPVAHAGETQARDTQAGPPRTGGNARAETHANAATPTDTPRRPRNSLLARAGPMWSALTPAQQDLLAPFEAQWNAWSAVEKRAWVVVAKRYPTLSQAKRDALRGRIRDWALLTPEQRRMARLNYRIARTLPKEARDEEVRRYRALTPEERDALQTSSTSNTAARHAGSRTGLAKHASQPMPGLGVPRAASH